MAYKPPKQSIIDNDTKGAPSNEAVFEALKLKLDEPTVLGSNGQLLQLDGYVSGEAVTSWVNPPSPGMSNPMTTAGDIIVGGTSGTPTRLALGDVDKVLVSTGSTVSYQYAGLGAGNLGTGNVIVGRAKPTNLTGTNNILMGPTTGNSLTTGYANVVIGNEIPAFAVGSGSSLTTGYYNTFLGIGTGSYLLTGYSNTYLGSFSGYESGFAGGTCNNNTFVGYYAGKSLRDGSNNTIIGVIDVPSTLSNTIILGAGSIERMRIDSVGNIGLGTNSPNAKLDISGTWSNGNGIVKISGTNGLSGFSLYDSTANALQAMLYAFDSQANVKFGAFGSRNLVFLTNTSNGDDNERMRIDSSGKVGIGTSAPTEKLEVNGNIKVGTVSFNANSNRQATVTNLGFLTATITHDFGSLSHGAEEEVAITVTGASVGDACFVGAPSTIEIGLSWDAYVSAADTVKLRVYNYQNSNSIDPASATWRVTVLKS